MVEHEGHMLFRCQKRRDGRISFERLHGKRPQQEVEVVSIGEKELTRPISTDPMNGMNTRYRFGIWLGARNNNAECVTGTLQGEFWAREVRRLERESTGQSND